MPQVLTRIVVELARVKGATEEEVEKKVEGNFRRVMRESA